MRRNLLSMSLSLVVCATVAIGLRGQESRTAEGPSGFTLPDGFEIEQVAGPPLISRPICADFDQLGRLYVVESSGSNEDIHVQYQKKPHRVVRLVDTDDDGRYDSRTMFAERMAFPEGAMWHDGSLYVAAPPEIWKLTDEDDDGVAERREVWFDGQTLGHCANDLHGPFLGPDGWIYWCKGAWAEQTYERAGRPPLVTRASHIFRRRPEGGEIEPVMTGGMDNPVEVVFTPEGERIFCTTFLQHPRDGRRDGLIHAIYGGVYGKPHGVLDGHPRTGELMPVLSHMGAAAPCGLHRYRGEQFGDSYRDNVFTCCFNMHKVTRHVLAREGASYRERTVDFLSSDDLDFHPTDVLEDADGSLIVVNTGGWYKLCCPTSQLHKPDVPGAIYRIKKSGSHAVVDPRGTEIPWTSTPGSQLAELLADPRPAVRRRAAESLAADGDSSVVALTRLLDHPAPAVRRRAVWVLTRIRSTEARRAARRALTDPDASVRQSAAHSASVWRDRQALDALRTLIRDPDAGCRRAAAEGLGRIGSAEAIPALWGAFDLPTDRALEHSLTFALIEIDDSDRITPGLSSENSRAKAATMIALDQMPSGRLDAEVIRPYLSSEDPILRQAAWWLMDRHEDWHALLVEYVRREVFVSRDRPEANRSSDAVDNSAAAGSQTPSIAELSRLLGRCANKSEVQQLLVEGLADPSMSRSIKSMVLDAMSAGRLDAIPSTWLVEIGGVLRSDSPELVAKAVSTARELSKQDLDERLSVQLRRIAQDDGRSAELRLQALATLLASEPKNSDEAQRVLTADLLRFACESLAADKPVVVRSLAVDTLTRTRLSTDQLTLVAGHAGTANPTDLAQLLTLFRNSREPSVGVALVQALESSPAVSALDPSKLSELLDRFGPNVRAEAKRLIDKLTEENRDKIEMMRTVLALVDGGDARRGQRVFHGNKAACSACHQMGYLGGQVGPDLSRIGRIRDRRDLLESVMFPNSSFVRSFEPATIVTVDGRVLNGIVRNETSTELVLALDAQKEVRIAREDIEERIPSETSIMPAGLDKQFTAQELADLILFLETSR